MSELVEIGTGRVVTMGESHYLLIPVSIRRMFDISAGDEFTFSRTSESPDLVLKEVLKAPEEK